MEQYYREVYRADYFEPPVEERYRADLAEAQIRVHRLSPLLRPDTHLLEVGCGSGAFLDAVRPHVGGTMGIEPDTDSRAFLRERTKIPLVADVADITHNGRVFDLVVMFHILEHVPDPIRFLRTISSQLLRPGGRLILEVPNVDDALVELYQVPAYLRFYYQKAHLYYFSRGTLDKVLVQAGLDASVEGVQRYDLSNHIRWMLTGQPGGQGYYNSVLSPSVNTVYADSLIRMGYADTLWAIANVRE